MSLPRISFRISPDTLQARQQQKLVAYGMLYGSIFIFVWQLITPGTPWSILVKSMLLVCTGLYFYHIFNGNQLLAGPPAVAGLCNIGVLILIKLHDWVLEIPTEELSVFQETAQSLVNFERLSTIIMLFIIVVITLIFKEGHQYREGQIYALQSNVNRTPDHY